MKYFGLATEGVTDQITLENILLGFFHGAEDLDEDEIAYLQPLLDATDKDGLGSWTRLLTYLKDKRFRDDVVNHRYMIVQVDTDIAAEKGFDVELTENNKQLPVIDIVEKITERLTEQIDSGQEGFYTEHQDKIIFAISVDCIEIWLFKYYNTDLKKQKFVKSGERHLAEVLIKKDKLKDFVIVQKVKNKINHGMDKTRDNYDIISIPFYKKKTAQQAIAKVYQHDESFKIFIDKLNQIPYP